MCKFTGKRDSEQSLHLASPWLWVLAAVARERAEESQPHSAASQTSLSPACSGKADAPPGKSTSSPFLIEEKLTQPLPLSSAYIYFSLGDNKMKPCRTEELPTICHLETAAALFPCMHYTQQVSAASVPPGLHAFGHRRSCRQPGFPQASLRHPPTGQKQERFKKW